MKIYDAYKLYSRKEQDAVDFETYTRKGCKTPTINYYEEE